MISLYIYHILSKDFPFKNVLAQSNDIISWKHSAYKSQWINLTQISLYAAAWNQRWNFIAILLNKGMVNGYPTWQSKKICNFFV